jgi:hypothetical protein
MMAQFKSVSLREAQEIALPRGELSDVCYREYVRSLGVDTAGRLDMEPSDDPVVERRRLLAAARAEGVALLIQQRDNVLVFWQVAATAASRSSSGRKASRRGKAPRADDTSWFFTPTWQAGERQVDEEIRAGRVKTFDDVDAFFADLYDPTTD